MLCSGGLLDPASRLCGGLTFPHGAPEDLVQGLIIDDFFAISCSELGAKGPSLASRALAQARSIYSREGLLGSVEKDIDGSCCATVGGAELDASASTRSQGIATVGPPRTKRLGLAAISLESCRLRKRSDVLHLCLVGGWVSGFCYRKAFMACFDKVFSFVDATKVDSSCPRVVDLPRSVADELVVAAALSHLLASDVSAPWAERLFATDSSESRGAIVQSPTSKEITSVLWSSTLKAAGPARLLSREALEGSSPKRPPACRFHYLQLWGASKGIGLYLGALGWTTGPCIDPKVSVEYDPSSVRVFEWVSFLVEAGRLDSLCICLPLATFSTHSPGSRSHSTPAGRRPSRKEALANRYTALSLGLLHVCLRHGVIAALLHSGASLVPRLKAWKDLCARREVQSNRLPLGCPSGGTLFLSVGFPPLEDLAQNWRRDSLVLPPEPALGEEIWLEAAAAFDFSLCLRSQALACCRLDTEGLETPLVNDLALSSKWTTRRAWSWPGPVHINILECSCIYRLMSSLARCSGPLRFVTLCDSAVTCHALRKGRSPSAGLRKVLRRISAVGFTQARRTAPRASCRPTTLPEGPRSRAPCRAALVTSGGIVPCSRSPGSSHPGDGLQTGFGSSLGSPAFDPSGLASPIATKVTPFGLSFPVPWTSCLLCLASPLLSLTLPGPIGPPRLLWWTSIPRLAFLVKGPWPTELASLALPGLLLWTSIPRLVFLVKDLSFRASAPLFLGSFSWSFREFRVRFL